MGSNPFGELPEEPGMSLQGFLTGNHAGNVLIFQQTFLVNLPRINSAFPVWSQCPAAPAGSTRRGHKDEQSSKAFGEIAVLGSTAQEWLPDHPQTPQKKTPLASWLIPAPLEPLSAHTRACLPQPSSSKHSISGCPQLPNGSIPILKKFGLRDGRLCPARAQEKLLCCQERFAKAPFPHGHTTRLAPSHRFSSRGSCQLPAGLS